MESVYFKELENYSTDYLENHLGINLNDLNSLFQYDIIKFNGEYCQFNYVGVIIIDNFVLYIYPKYITNEDNIENDFKQTLHVIKKYKRLNENFEYENDEVEDVSFNLLSMMIFFIEDYYENGIYNNIQNILEINGNGEINWDRTINDNFAIIKNNKPYYVELQTKYKIDDIFDYFRLLHECIITECSKRLEKAGLLELFDLTPIELSEMELDDFGECDFISNKLTKELNVEFNTHKQKLLRSMRAYVSKRNSLTNQNYLTLYGTSTYHKIWEDICCKVFGNKLKKHLSDLKLPQKLNEKYNPNKELIGIIKKPKWILKEGEFKADTFKPDLITFYDDNFIIFDAKYYKIKITKKIEKQPGLSDITKQYLYELAYKDFIDFHNFKGVKNAFLMPTYESEIENRGHVKIEILHDLGLENIQVIMLPAREMNQMYLDNKKMDIKMLNL